MATKADFYLGDVWIGSLLRDGYPSQIAENSELFQAKLSNLTPWMPKRRKS